MHWPINNQLFTNIINTRGLLTLLLLLFLTVDCSMSRNNDPRQLSGTYDEESGDDANTMWSGAEAAGPASPVDDMFQKLLALDEELEKSMAIDEGTFEGDLASNKGISRERAFERRVPEMSLSSDASPSPTCSSGPSYIYAPPKETIPFSSSKYSFPLKASRPSVSPPSSQPMFSYPPARKIPPIATLPIRTPSSTPLSQTPLVVRPKTSQTIPQPLMKRVEPSPTTTSSPHEALRPEDTDAQTSSLSPDDPLYPFSNALERLSEGPSAQSSFPRLSSLGNFSFINSCFTFLFSHGSFMNFLRGIEFGEKNIFDDLKEIFMHMRNRDRQGFISSFKQLCLSHADLKKFLTRSKSQDPFALLKDLLKIMRETLSPFELTGQFPMFFEKEVTLFCSSCSKNIPIEKRQTVFNITIPQKKDMLFYGLYDIRLLKAKISRLLAQSEQHLCEVPKFETTTEIVYTTLPQTLLLNIDRSNLTLSEKEARESSSLNVPKKLDFAEQYFHLSAFIMLLDSNGVCCFVTIFREKDQWYLIRNEDVFLIRNINCFLQYNTQVHLMFYTRENDQ